MYDIIELNSKLLTDLKQIAKDLKMPKFEKLNKQEIIYKILDHQALNPTKDILDKEKNAGKRPRTKKRKIAATSETTSKDNLKVKEEPQKKQDKSAGEKQVNMPWCMHMH